MAEEKMFQGYKGGPLASVIVSLPIYVEHLDGTWVLHWTWPHIGGQTYPMPLESATTQREAAALARHYVMERLCRENP